MSAPSTVDPETVRPTIDFLSWADDHHFTFLGYRSYDYVEDGDQAFLRSVPGSGLGILRDQADEKRVQARIEPVDEEMKLPFFYPVKG